MHDSKDRKSHRTYIVFSGYFSNRLEFATVQINIQGPLKIQDYITDKLLDGRNKKHEESTYLNRFQSDLEKMKQFRNEAACTGKLPPRTDSKDT